MLVEYATTGPRHIYQLYLLLLFQLDFVKDSGVTKDIGIIAVMLGALRLVVIFLGTCSSKLMGRRFTALVSGIGMTPCLLVLAYLQYSKNKGKIMVFISICESAFIYHQNFGIDFNGSLISKFN